MRRALAGLLTLCIVALAAVVLAGVPEGKETLKIDHIEGKKGAVTFPHAKHVDEFKKPDGSAITCKDCHHTAATEADAKACVSCHVKEGEAQVESGGQKARFVAVAKGDGVDQKSVIFHETCLGCHKKIEGKKITSCKTCH